MKKVLILGLSFPMLIGCMSVTKQKRDTTIMDASQEDTLGGTGTSSADIRSMAERMARDIAGLRWPADMPHPRIALTKIDNETRFPINPNVIKDRLLVDLVEFSTGLNIRFTESAQGAQYRLEARITSLSKGSSHGVSDYLLYSFKLKDVEDTVVWAKSYETKKQGTSGVMYR